MLITMCRNSTKPILTECIFSNFFPKSLYKAFFYFSYMIFNLYLHFNDILLKVIRASHIL